MIEVDTVRRNFNVGHYDPGFMMASHPLSAAGIGAPHMDGHRVLVHWHQPPNVGNQQNSSLSSNTSGVKSDEEDDDDDEDRPFTPPPPRERLSYTRYQLELLNGIYLEVRYPNSTQKQLIAKRVGITREQVKIWFQNRRRKDVIGNTGKSKSCDTSTCSSSSSGSKDSDQQSSPTPTPDVDENSSSSEENASPKDSEDTVVPSLVMKSVIGELIKFTNDPLKGKKNRKKAKAKQKEREKASLKKSLASTLLAGSYDMISPPNQITPTAFFEKLKSGFNHSKNTSAFACPRGSLKPAQISNVSSTSETSTVSVPGKTVSDIPKTLPSPVTGRPFPIPSVPNSYINGPCPPFSSDLPVLSDILSYKSSLEARHKDLMSSAPVSMSSALPTSPPQRENSNTDNALPPQHPLSPLTSGRHLNGIYPYPFLAEQPMLLSSLRQPDHIFRPAPHYPHYGDDPFQPVFISSLSNPYYSPPSGAWPSLSAQAPSAYTQL